MARTTLNNLYIYIYIYNDVQIRMTAEVNVSVEAYEGHPKSSTQLTTRYTHHIFHFST